MQSRAEATLRVPAMERRHQTERADRDIFGKEPVFAGREFARGRQESPSHRSHDQFQCLVSFVSRPLCGSLQRDSKAFQNSLSFVLPEFP
jgi:hypothetical protein